MSGRLLSLIDRHCEKGVLAAGAGLVLWVGWAYLLQTPNRVVLDGRSLTPRELHEVILREAQALERGMGNAKTPELKFPACRQRLDVLHERGIFGREDQPGGLPSSPRLPLAAAFGPKVDLTLARPVPVRVVPPAVPERPRLLTGRCLQVPEHAADRSDAAGSEPREVGWVRIVTRFDRERRRVALLAAGYPEYAAKVYLVGVDAQRQEVLPDGGFGRWVAVRPVGGLPNGAILRPAFDDRTGRLLNRAELDAALAEVKAQQACIGRPTLKGIIAGDRPATMMDAEPAGEEAAPSAGSPLVWVDDAQVEAGRFYRYRVRVRLWNRFVGRRQAVVEAADAELAVLEGEWSEPSEAIRAAPRTHVFVLGRSLHKPAANVEVWKWHGGEWLRASFAVAVGEVIGGARTVRLPERDRSGSAVRAKVDFETGVTLLDMREQAACLRIVDGKTGRFDWAERSDLVVVCSDRVSGRVEERSQLADKKDRLRDRLRRP